MVNGIHSPVEVWVKALGRQDVAWMAVALTDEASTHIFFICNSNRLAATMADSPYGSVASAIASTRLNVGGWAAGLKRTGKSEPSEAAWF
jgi:hypothetical protein